MTKARETFEGKKLSQMTVRFTERTELRLFRKADAIGIPAATLARIALERGLRAMDESSLEDLLDSNESPSGFQPLS